MGADLPRLTDAVREDAAMIADVIRRSYADVAQRFGLTPETAPTHPSNCEPSWIERGLDRGDPYIVARVDEVPVGCVSLSRRPGRPIEMRRLAVLSKHRRSGYGRVLFDAANDRAQTLGATIVDVSLIADNVELADWYRRLGCVETGRARYDSVPFEVLHMTYTL